MKWPTHIVSSIGIVMDAHQNVLIGRHPRRGWDFTGGQVENGENLEQGVLREIFEESGIEADLRCLTGIYSNVNPLPSAQGVPPIPTMLHFVFQCSYIAGTPRLSEETLQLLWVPQQKVLDYIQRPISRLWFQHLLAFDGRVNYCAYEMAPRFRVLYSRYV